MQMDFYSKAVMTVIAVALAVLAIGQFSPNTAIAQGASCGSSASNPCYITNDGVRDLDVKVGNTITVRTN